MASHINNNLIQELLEQAEKDRIQKIVVRAVIKRNNKFLLLERAFGDFLGGLVVLPGGSVDKGESLLQALAREIKEEVNLKVIGVTAYLGSFDCASSSGKKIRQFNFLVETKLGSISLDKAEHSRYFLLNPSHKEFSKLNISDDTKKVLVVAGGI